MFESVGKEDLFLKYLIKILSKERSISFKKSVFKQTLFVFFFSCVGIGGGAVVQEVLLLENSVLVIDWQTNRGGK